MAKVIIMFEQPKDKDGFEAYYFNVHLSLVNKIPNVKKVTTHRILKTEHTDLDLYFISEIHFDHLEMLQYAMATPYGEEIMNDLPKMLKYLHRHPIVSIVE